VGFALRGLRRKTTIRACNKRSSQLESREEWQMLRRNFLALMGSCFVALAVVLLAGPASSVMADEKASCCAGKDCCKNGKCGTECCKDGKACGKDCCQKTCCDAKGCCKDEKCCAGKDCHKDCCKDGKCGADCCKKA
jgi:hypothetical protein